MVRIRKEYIVDEAGKPTKVIISLADLRLLEEMLGLDLDEEALGDLLQARRDREGGRDKAYLDLDGQIEYLEDVAAVYKKKWELATGQDEMVELSPQEIQEWLGDD